MLDMDITGSFMLLVAGVMASAVWMLNLSHGGIDAALVIHGWDGRVRVRHCVLTSYFYFCIHTI